MPRPTVELTDVECIKETDEALLCIIDDDEVWIPRSHVNEDETEVFHEGDLGTLVVTEWMATEKGLI